MSKIKKFLVNGGYGGIAVVILLAVLIGMMISANIDWNKFKQACHEAGGVVLSRNSSTCVEPPKEIFIGLYEKN